MGRRVIQLGKELEKSLAKVLEEIDCSPAQLVTVTEVSLSSLLDQARVFIGVFPSQYGEEALKKIQKEKGKIKKNLPRFLKVRKMPEINFYLDTGLEKAAKIERILHQLENEEKGGTVAKE